MYKYSDLINVIHPNASNINLHCNDYDPIEYDTQILPDEEELLYLARNEYDPRKIFIIFILHLINYATLNII